MGATTEPAFDLRQFGYVTVRQFGNSVGFTLPARAVNFGGIEPGDTFRITEYEGKVRYTPEGEGYRVEPLPGERDFGTRQAVAVGGSSLSATVPRSALELLDAGEGSWLAFSISAGGAFELDRWD